MFYSLLKNGVFKFPTILCYYFFLKFFKVYFIYSGALMLGAYVSITVIYFWWIDPFIIICLYIISSLSLVTVFVLMSILSDVTIASSLYLPFTCDIFFFLLLSACVWHLKLKWVFYRMHIVKILTLFMFSSPSPELALGWANQEGCLLHLRFSLRSSDLPLFYFHGLFPFFVL